MDIQKKEDGTTILSFYTEQQKKISIVFEGAGSNRVSKN